MRICSKFTIHAITFILLLILACVLRANPNKTFLCVTPEEIYQALAEVKGGDTILLEGGTVYELEKRLLLAASGKNSARIHLTSKDFEGRGRYATLTTVGGRKEQKLVGIFVTGSFWHISKIEISGRRLPLADGYWDTHGFRIGIYFSGADAHHNIVEDVLIHHTHNAAVAVRKESHHIEFRRLRINQIGEWLDAEYDAHEAEGFYIGSSKDLHEAGRKAIAHHVTIEDCVIGPGVLGQFVDIKYAASHNVVRNNQFHCMKKTYNKEIMKIAGYANLIEGNRFIGRNGNLRQYILVKKKVKNNPPLVTYLGREGIHPPSGEDNIVRDNFFPEDHTGIKRLERDGF
jgi:hypothetical protein